MHALRGFGQNTNPGVPESAGRKRRCRPSAQTSRSDSCSFSQFCRSWRKLQARGLRRQPGRERLLRSGRIRELDGLFRRLTAYSVHTRHTWHAPAPAKYAKYVPTMCRGSWRTMRDRMHLQLPMESRSRPEPVSIASHADPFLHLPECITRAPGSATISRSDSSRRFTGPWSD